MTIAFRRFLFLDLLERSNNVLQQIKSPQPNATCHVHYWYPSVLLWTFIFTPSWTILDFTGWKACLTETGFSPDRREQFWQNPTFAVIGCHDMKSNTNVALALQLAVRRWPPLGHFKWYRFLDLSEVRSRLYRRQILQRTGPFATFLNLSKIT